MAVTPNYNWPLPDDTSLVKDGAEAIRDLGNAIDTTVENLPSGGLQHIESQTFSAVSAVSFNDVFSATFDIYKLIIIGSGTGTANFAIRLRVGGSDNSSNIYIRNRIQQFSTTVTGNTTTSTELSFANALNSQEDSSVVEITNPFATKKTGFRTIAGEQGGLTTIIGGLHNLASSFDGFTILKTAGTNLSGQAILYGYRK